MSQDNLKKAAAREAFEYVESLLEDDSIVGIGTGSTANYFIEELGAIAQKIEGTVASSEESAKRLTELNIPVFDLNSVGDVSVYVDGADESQEACDWPEEGCWFDYTANGAANCDAAYSELSSTYTCEYLEANLNQSEKQTKLRSILRIRR